jgi:hypothetical protein
MAVPAAAVADVTSSVAVFVLSMRIPNVGIHLLSVAGFGAAGAIPHNFVRLVENGAVVRRTDENA